MALGVIARVYHVMMSGFPLNDGGLFFAMTRDLQDSSFALPAFASYNGGTIPFAYPPLGFYLTGLLDLATPLSLFDLYRFVPLIVSCLTLPGFYLLARETLRSRLAVAGAVLAFALMPRSFVWLLMGGGVTRSFGLLFAILALYCLRVVLRKSDWRFSAAAALFAALTVLSHLETGWFLAISVAIMAGFYGRSRPALLRSAAVAGAAAVIVAPWAISVIAEHGLAPFEAAQATGGSIFSDGETRRAALTGLVNLVASSEPAFPVLGALGVLGGLVCLVTKRFYLVAWWAAVILLDVRAYPTFVTLPVAMMAGIAVSEVVVPLLQRGLSNETWVPHGSAGTRSVGGQGPGVRLVPGLAGGMPRLAPAALLIVAAVVAYATIGAMTQSPRFGGEGVFLKSLSADELSAMTWVKENTPVDSQFLLVPATSWETARDAEWFPVLAERKSVATVQGTEWLPGGAFQSSVDAYYAAYDCGYKVSLCLDEWQVQYGISFSHIYIGKAIDGQCCGTLLESLLQDTRYQLLYDGPGATVFGRAPAGAPEVVTIGP